MSLALTLPMTHKAFFESVARMVALAAVAAGALCQLGCQEAPTQPGAGASGASASAAPKKARVPRTDASKTVVDVALGSKDHTTLVAALEAAGLVESLDSPGGVYTVFAPTNAAFDKLPKGTVEGLLKPEKLTDLKNILQHHASVPVRQLKDFKDGEKISMADGTTVTMHVEGDKVKVNDANVLGSVQTMNGVVHVVDAVLVPDKK